METIYNVIPQFWNYESTQGQRSEPPTEDDLMFVQDEDGNHVPGPDGQFMRIPKPGWQPQVEQVNLDTVVLIDPQSGSVFKFMFDSEGLANFLGSYFSHLNLDQRQIIRQALADSSPISVATLNTDEVVQDIRGMNRETRRAASRGRTSRK